MINLPEIPIKTLLKFFYITGGVLVVAFLFLCFEFYIPVNPSSTETITFTLEKGWSNKQIASALEEAGLIRNGYFFKLYAVMSFKHLQMQAGDYRFSPKMSLHQIANKMAKGQIIRDIIVIPEGWDIKDIGKYLESKGLCLQQDFETLANKNYSKEYVFLKQNPQGASLEGYLFPDTYQIEKDANCQDVLKLMLSNFDKKLTSEMRLEIQKQNKSLFDIITMASIIEKEARTSEDRVIVSGIFWKRLSVGMALQSCATVNYITGKNDPGISLADMQINSLYNTYKYRGLPKGPISNPGLDSINASIYPTESEYWYFLSNGKTIFSKTLEEHNQAKALYLGG